MPVEEMPREPYGDEPRGGREGEDGESGGPVRDRAGQLLGSRPCAGWFNGPPYGGERWQDPAVGGWSSGERACGGSARVQERPGGEGEADGEQAEVGGVPPAHTRPRTRSPDAGAGHRGTTARCRPAVPARCRGMTGSGMGTWSSSASLPGGPG